MVIAEQKYITEDIKNYVREKGNGRENLLPLLHFLQNKYGYVGEFIHREVGKNLDLSPAEVYGVTSFYSFFTTKPKGQYIIRICRTISCEMAGKDKIVKVLESELGMKMGETTHDGKFTLEYTNCIGMCDKSPALLINDKVFYDLTPEKIHKYLQRYIGGVYEK